MAEMMIIQQPKFYAQRKTARPSDAKKLYRFEEENVAWLSAYFLGEEEVPSAAPQHYFELKLLIWVSEIAKFLKCF